MIAHYICDGSHYSILLAHHQQSMFSTSIQFVQTRLIDVVQALLQLRDGTGHGLEVINSCMAHQPHGVMDWVGLIGQGSESGDDRDDSNHSIGERML